MLLSTSFASLTVQKLCDYQAILNLVCKFNQCFVQLARVFPAVTGHVTPPVPKCLTSMTLQAFFHDRSKTVQIL